MIRTIYTQGPAVLVFVLFVAVWSLAALLMAPGESGGPVLLPQPTVVVAELYRLVVEQGFLWDIGQSIKRILLGILAAAIPAFPLGIWFGISPRLYAAATPIFSFAKYVPPVALVPFLILLLGVGLTQQIALLFIGTFFYLTVMVAETVVATPTAFREASLTLGANKRQYVLGVIVPYGLPGFIQHIRVMMGIAWTYITVAEMVGTQDGIGRVIINAQRYLQTGKLLAGVLTIGILGIMFDLLLVGTSWFLCRWRR